MYSASMSHLPPPINGGLGGPGIATDGSGGTINPAALNNNPGKIFSKPPCRGDARCGDGCDRGRGRGRGRSCCRLLPVAMMDEGDYDDTNRRTCYIRPASLRGIKDDNLLTLQCSQCVSRSCSTPDKPPRHQEKSIARCSVRARR
jgi:hypothetical protein